MSSELHLTSGYQEAHSFRRKLMNTLKHMGSILLAVLLCVTALVLAAPDPEFGERVSLAKLIASPDAYHGKALWIVANVTIDFENMTACPSGG